MSTSDNDARWDDGWDFVIWAGLILFGVFVGIPLLGTIFAVVAALGAAVLGLVFAAAPFLIGLAVIAAIISWLSDAI